MIYVGLHVAAGLLQLVTGYVDGEMLRNDFKQINAW